MTDRQDGAADFWEQPEMVARMADRPPDRRLVQLFERTGVFAAVHREWEPPAAPRVLDVGCAGGRNTVYAAGRGAGIWAIDASRAMVRETRRRLAELTGTETARERVRHGRMRDLGAWPDGHFDLVIALGVLQDADGYAAWTAALAEISRVLRPGGLCLVANFGPDSEPQGRPLETVPGERYGRLGFGPADRHMTLPDKEELDAEFLAHGLVPALPTEEARTETGNGFRTTLNALYRRQPGRASAADAL